MKISRDLYKDPVLVGWFFTLGAMAIITISGTLGLCVCGTLYVMEKLNL